MRNKTPENRLQTPDLFFNFSFLFKILACDPCDDSQLRISSKFKPTILWLACSDHNSTFLGMSTKQCVFFHIKHPFTIYIMVLFSNLCFEGNGPKVVGPTSWTLKIEPCFPWLTCFALRLRLMFQGKNDNKRLGRKTTICCFAPYYSVQSKKTSIF